MPAGFADIHSHVVPSGDDGAQSPGEGAALCRDAQAHGTSLLYATPHVSPQLTLSAERERRVRRAYRELRQRVPLELRLGFELTPMAALLEEDPWRYVLEQSEHVLVEIPFVGSEERFLQVGEWIERSGLLPIVAHPERTEAVLSDPALADRLAERGWLLQVNASSLLGHHGAEREEQGWRLVEERLAALVASDGHRETRPARLDEAYELVRARMGEGQALALFDGSALGLATTRRLPSPAASRGA
ncbi:MAG TPA: CpsB/CapC family capsule biosynthesis tyrosine phosphatase [Gaiellaceae bacterium]